MPSKALTHKTRVMQILDAYGWMAADVELPIYRGPDQFPLKRDLWNVFDILAINPREAPHTLALQVTSPSNVAAHVRKMLIQRRTLGWALASNWRVELWGLRDAPAANESPVLARTFWLSDDGSVLVKDGSSILGA